MTNYFIAVAPSNPLLNLQSLRAYKDNFVVRANLAGKRMDILQVSRDDATRRRDFKKQK